jgi:phage repressor protein C with HTH and peptisase S24 domain
VHQGEWLKDRVQKSKLSVSEFARRVAVARSRVHDWFTQETLSMRPDLMWSVLDVLGLRETVESYGHARPADYKPPGVEDVHGTLRDKYTVEGVFSRLIREDKLLGSVPAQRPAMRIVEDAGDAMPAVFDLPIAASGWEEIGVGASPTDSQWVIVRVRGDSMKPRFKDGMLVLFKRLDATEDAPVAGHDYFVIRNDGTGTLKRLVDVDEDGFTFKAINPKYPRPLRCSRDETVMIAEARYGVVELPEL